MSTEQQLMDSALDNIGLADDDNPIEPDIIDDDPEVIEDAVIIDDEPPEDPPGFTSYEDWIAAGKDPDDWQGKNKYNQQYELIQDNKGIKSELRGMNDMLRQTVDATNSMRDKAYQEGLDQANEDLKEAMENNDAKAVNDARDKIDNLEKPVAPPEQPQVNPLHQQFFDTNPVIDQGDAQYDPEVMGEFERIYNGRLRADGVGRDTKLSERAIKGYMNDALKSAKSLFPEKFESKRNTRQTTGKSTPKRTASKKNPVSSIKAVEVKTRNRHDTSPVMDLYNTILKDKNGGKAAADAFAAKMGIEE